MAWNFTSPSLPTASPRLQTLDRFPPKSHAIASKPAISERHPLYCRASQSGGVKEDPTLKGSSSYNQLNLQKKLSSTSPDNSSSARTQLDLLEQLTSSPSQDTGYESEGSAPMLTIREQLSRLFSDRDGDFTIRLGKGLKKEKILNISQKRNIKRQAYLNEVGRRNDSVFYAIIGAFVLLPPVAILSVAILTGYVQLFP